MLNIQEVVIERSYMFSPIAILEMYGQALLEYKEVIR